MPERKETSFDRKILVLVEDLFYGVKIASLLKQMRYSFQIFSSESDALQVLENSSPPLVILDLDFQPEGLKILKKMKKDNTTRDIPIIAYSRHTEKELMENARKLGCRDVLSRPEFLRNLPDLVKSVLHESGEDGKKEGR